MRKIGLLAAAFAATASLLAPAAHAGTAASPYCFDGTWTDVPVLNSPVTLGVETHADGNGEWVTVCYATSPVGYTGAHFTGGFLKVYVANDGSGFVDCRPDGNPYVVYHFCYGTFSFQPGAGGLQVLVTDTSDTNATSPVVVGQTGLVISPFVTIGGGVSVTPRRPCVYVLGAQVVPGCGTLII